MIPEYKQHVPFAQLDSCHVSRAKIFHRRFLDITMYGDNVKLHVVNSSSCTGKTRSVFDYARTKNLKVRALATRISQLNAHDEVIAMNKEESDRYDSRTLKTSKIGSKHLLSTIDSVSGLLSF